MMKPRGGDGDREKRPISALFTLDGEGGCLLVTRPPIEWGGMKDAGSRLQVAASALPGLEREVVADRTVERTTFRLSPQARKAMLVTMVGEGYTLKHKSRWVQDAIDAFLAPETWRLGSLDTSNAWKRIVIDTALQREAMQQEVVMIQEALRRRVWRAAIDAALYGAELDDPVHIEISIAAVIRAAIIWRVSNAKRGADATVAPT